MGALRAFAVRVFVGYFLVLGAAAYFALAYFGDAVKPAVRQTMEETLVEEAHLLASVIEADMTSDRLELDRFRATWATLGARRFDAKIYGVEKTTLAQRVYVTDARGRVAFDSARRGEGDDYSQWNDVKRTLRGEYGARSTHDTGPDGPSTLYIAAPIRSAGGIVGVVSVGKTAAQVEPFVALARKKLLRSGSLIFAGSLVVGLAIAVFLSRSISRLVDYAKRVAGGERVPLPEVGGELRELATAVDTMRTSLEGKQYVEKTIQTMAHELKSPLTAIVGAAELLEGPVADADRRRFALQVGSEAKRMQAIVERLLELAVLEQRRAVRDAEPIALRELVDRIVESRGPVLRERELTIAVAGSATADGERVLLEHAVSNLVDNAIQFARAGTALSIAIALDGDGAATTLVVTNEGPHIPDFAKDRIFERFYSLPRPDTDRRSTGLGLPFVKQVAELHRGSIALENKANGDRTAVSATLRLPAFTPSS